jgi:hypothetical protein
MKRAVWALALVACSASRDTAPLSSVSAPSKATLPAGIVADIGPLAISTENVAAVASARHIDPRDALDREIRDAVFASGALSEHLDELPSARAALRAALARAALEALKKEAAQTEPTDEEVAEATARHFVHLDRPETFRVIHAVVQFPETAEASVKSRARSLAERIAERVGNARDEAEFRAAVESVDKGGLEVTVESLPPVAADGRIVDDEHPFDGKALVLPFSHAASRLTHPGQKSGIVTTEFGYHTMMLLDRAPARFVPLDERRRLLRDEILTDRAKKLKDELLSRIKSTLSANVERSADTLLSTVDVASHEVP